MIVPRNSLNRGGFRVLLVAPQPTYEDRGTPIAVVQVLRALAESGCEVDVLTYPVGEDVPLPGVRWLRVANPFRFRHVPVGLSMRKVVLDVLIAAKMARLLGSRRYDYVHAVEEAAFIAAALGASTGTPVLYDMQSSIPQHLSRHPVFGTRPAQAALRFCERWLLRRARLVVASAGLASYVKELEPSVRVEEWRFPPAVWSGRLEEALELRRGLGLPDGARTVVYSGTFTEYQGLPALVAAARSVVREEPDTVFVTVGGDAKGRCELEALVRGSDLSRNFRIVGRERRERALAYLGLADVLVSPRAHGDNLPLKIADYMAASKPIVATRIPAHTIVLDPSRAVLTETDGEDLARGILTVLRDRDEAQRLAKAARQYGEQHMGWPAFKKSVRGHIRDVVRHPVRVVPVAPRMSRPPTVERRVPRAS
jgi:glycosyltransferase involved in cell wall biosynthesis